MRVLHVNSYYGKGLFYKNLYDNQIKKINIDVFVPLSNQIKYQENHGSYTTISYDHNKYDRIFFHLKHNKILNDIQQKYKISDYDIIHAHSLFSNGYIAYKLKEKFDIPYIVAVRNTDINVFFKKLIYLRKLGINILKNAQYIIVLSNTYKKQLIENYIPKKLKKYIEEKILVIPNGISDEWINNKCQKKSHPTSKNLVLAFTGRIEKNKNVSKIVDACNILINRGYKVKLNVIGKICDKKIYNYIIKNDFVNVLGEKKVKEIMKIYNKSDIFVMPSFTETFGLVYAEAITQSLPVIYTENQGFDLQFKEGEVGYHVNPMDEEDIADKIEKIYKNYDNISASCYKNAEKYNWNDISNKYIKIYEKVGAMNAK